MIEYIGFSEGEEKELSDVARLFFLTSTPNITVKRDGDKIHVCVEEVEYATEQVDYSFLNIPDHAAKTRAFKFALYSALSLYTGRKMPWGGLTGVRPTKLFYELSDAVGFDSATSLLQKIYGVSRPRAELLKQIAISQRGFYFKDDNAYNLYIHIPFCSSKCTYCSFISFPIKSCGVVSEYVNALADEIRRTVALMDKLGKRLLSVYVGGGTPTSVSASELEVVLSSFDSRGTELRAYA